MRACVLGNTHILLWSECLCPLPQIQVEILTPRNDGKFTALVLFLLLCFFPVSFMGFFSSLWPFEVFLCSLILHLWHMEVSRPGSESELRLAAYARATATQDVSPCPRPSPQLTAVLDPLTPLKLGIEPISSWILVGFITLSHIFH